MLTYTQNDNISHDEVSNFRADERNVWDFTKWLKYIDGGHFKTVLFNWGSSVQVANFNYDALYTYKFSILILSLFISLKQICVSVVKIVKC